MVIELLEGIHFVASLEAMSLGAQAGIHPFIIYDIISNAAGNSWWVHSYNCFILGFDHDESHTHAHSLTLTCLFTSLAKCVSMLCPSILLVSSNWLCVCVCALSIRRSKFIHGSSLSSTLSHITVYMLVTSCFVLPLLLFSVCG